MSARPVVGIICCNRLVGGEAAQSVMDRYVVATMRYADCSALLIPAMPDLVTLEDVIARLDGVLLTGSPSNIGARLYGEEDADGPFDAARDDSVMRLIDVMAGAGKPLFGICRGFQEINVALGGTLRRDVAINPALLPHHAPEGVSREAMFAHHHRVDLTPGGILASALGQSAVDVNSVHFQGVGTLAPPLSVEARAPDGLIEAVAMDLADAPLLAVQWHPEWQTDQNPDSQAFFRLLGSALRGEGISA